MLLRRPAGTEEAEGGAGGEKGEEWGEEDKKERREEQALEGEGGEGGEGGGRRESKEEPGGWEAIEEEKVKQQQGSFSGRGEHPST